MADIYVVINRQQSGPFSEEEVRARFARGELRLADLYWTEGMTQWAPLGQWIGWGTAPASGAGPAPPFPAYVPPPSLPQRYGGFWIRVGATLLDGLVLGMVIGTPMNIVMQSFMPMPPPNIERDPKMAAQFLYSMIPLFLISMAVHLIAQWLYHAFMESSSRQATLGKMACGLVITDLEGNRLSFGRATARFFAKNIITSWFTFGIGFMMAGWTKRNQALHDMICGTLVIRREQTR